MLPAASDIYGGVELQKRILITISLVLLLTLIFALPCVASEVSTEETTELRETENYNATKGSIYDTVYTLWYWIFGDSFTTADKVCCILSVITIVWGMWSLLPRRVRG